jgi:hypothetical protein
VTEVSDNIKAFSFWAAYLLGCLHRKFPRRVDVELKRESFDSLFWPQEEQEQYFYDLFDWLRDNGYISFSDKDQMLGADDIIVWQVALTERGFRTLQSLPDTLEPKKSIGSRLAEASADVATQASKDALVEGGRSLFSSAGEFLGGVVKGIMN